jgi:hypothetical protein
MALQLALHNNIGLTIHQGVLPINHWIGLNNHNPSSNLDLPTAEQSDVNNLFKSVYWSKPQTKLGNP